MFIQITVVALDSILPFQSFHGPSSEPTVDYASFLSPSPVGESCKYQLGRMVIIKDDLIGNSLRSMSIFVQSERSFQRTFVSLFKMSTINDLLCKQFGIRELKPFQKETLENLLDGRDVNLSMKTGDGKSLCYATTKYVRILVRVSLLQKLNLV